MAEYKTYADALRAVEDAVEDTLRDQPHLRPQEDDVFHDMVQAIMPDCDPDLAAELSQRTGVDIPGYLFNSIGDGDGAPWT
jgi:hypothetical protein